MNKTLIRFLVVFIAMLALVLVVTTSSAQGCAANTDSLPAYSFPFTVGSNCGQLTSATPAQSAAIYFERQIAAGASANVVGCPGNTDSLAAYSFPYIPGTNCTQRVPGITQADAATVYFLRLLATGGGGGGGVYWSLTGNALSSGQFLGTTTYSNKRLVFKVNNFNAGFLDSNKTGFNPYSTAFGYRAGNIGVATGIENTMFGLDNGDSLTIGFGNVGVGDFVMCFSACANAQYDTHIGTLSGQWDGGSKNTGVGAVALRRVTTGSNNTACGGWGLDSLTTGSNNTACGMEVQDGNRTGNDNTAIGYDAMYYNNTGDYNTAVGTYALETSKANTNTAVGFQALKYNINGINNVASGANALANSTGSWNVGLGTNAADNRGAASSGVFIGNDCGYVDAVDGNTAVGDSADASNSSGIQITALGYQALAKSTGSFNTAEGYQALVNNTTGTNNTANGTSTLNMNTTGTANVGNGQNCLHSNTTGSTNTATGHDAMFQNSTGSSNDADGNYAGFNNTGSFNTFLGDSAGNVNVSGRNNTFIGYDAISNASASNVIVAGNVNSDSLRTYAIVCIKNPITTVEATTSGSVRFSQPFGGVGADKFEIVIYLNAALGTSSYTFPLACSNTPGIIATSGIPASMVTSLSSTAVTITGTGASGYIFLEGGN